MYFLYLDEPLVHVDPDKGRVLIVFHAQAEPDLDHREHAGVRVFASSYGELFRAELSCRQARRLRRAEVSHDDALVDIETPQGREPSMSLYELLVQVLSTCELD